LYRSPKDDARRDEKRFSREGTDQELYVPASGDDRPVAVSAPAPAPPADTVAGLAVPFPLAPGLVPVREWLSLETSSALVPAP